MRMQDAARGRRLRASQLRQRLLEPTPVSTRCCAGIVDSGVAAEAHRRAASREPRRRPGRHGPGGNTRRCRQSTASITFDRDRDFIGAEPGANVFQAAFLGQAIRNIRFRMRSPIVWTARNPDSYGFSILKKPRSVGLTTMITLTCPRISGATGAEVNSHVARRTSPQAEHADPQALADRAMTAVGGDHVTARTIWVRPVSRSSMTAVTPSASCSNEVMRVPKQLRAEFNGALLKEHPARLRNETGRGRRTSTSLLRPRHRASSFPARVSTAMTAPSWSNCSPDFSRTIRSMPTSGKSPWCAA